LKCPDSDVAERSRIGGLRWIGSRMKADPKESDKHGLLESHHLHVTQ